MILIRPKFARENWFGFDQAHDFVAEGYRAAIEALDHLEAWSSAKSGWGRQARRPKPNSTATGAASEPRILANSATNT